MARWRSQVVFLMLLAGLLFSGCATMGVSQEDLKRAEAFRNLGEAHLREGNYTAALAELRKAEAINPDDPVLHNHLGLVFMARERVDDAIVHFEKAVQLNPDYSLAKNNLGSAYLVDQEWDKAIAVLEPVTEDLLYATPHFPLANLGWAYYNKQQYDRARQYLQKALKLDPEFFIARLNLGRTYLAVGQLRQALALFEALADTNPTNPALLLELGRTYRLLGDDNSATLALRGAIEFSEDARLTVEASQELNRIGR